MNHEVEEVEEMSYTLVVMASLDKELGELSKKITKLEKYVKSNNFLDEDFVQQQLINIQICAMKTYGECLHERLNRLGDGRR
jgi:hypothetical protein